MDLLRQKKFRVALGSAITLIALKLGVPELTVVELGTLASPFLFYIHAQGRADQGKEAVKQQQRGPGLP